MEKHILLQIHLFITFWLRGKYVSLMELEYTVFIIARVCKNGIF